MSSHALLAGAPAGPEAWQLLHLQLTLEETGHQVTNLGAHVPEELVAHACRTHQPDLVLLACSGRHAQHEATRLSGILRPHLPPDTRVVTWLAVDDRVRAKHHADDLAARLRAGAG
ncbi:hypothetical protein [Streptomyces sp. NPDC051001]|uniref:hypothetical protein n=1 Tax=Streptomyces sp. NPDC051001 TaxID=3155795 RepID=UPI003425C945